MWGQLEDWLLRVSHPPCMSGTLGKLSPRVSDRPSQGQGKGKTGPSYKEHCEESWEERARGQGRKGATLRGTPGGSGRRQMKLRLGIGQGSADGGLGRLPLVIYPCLSPSVFLSLSLSLSLVL